MTTQPLTLEALASLPADREAPTGVVLKVAGHSVKSENGTFRLYSAHVDGKDPLVFWKRINTRTGEWSKGGNTSRNFKGERFERFRDLVAEGIITIEA